jgi:haloalkane dehalogenase
MSIKRKIFVRAPLFVVCAIGLALSACGADDSETLPPDPEAGISCTAALQTRTSANGVQYVRTPNSCFNNLPDWNYEVKYVEIDGLRQAYYEAGPKSGEPILLLHGQPTWSYLYRFMIPVLAQGGYRVIAMDHVGMGRSDKPIDLKYHSFENHVNRLESFIRKLELKNLTAFVQDWGSVTGLTLASRKPELFDRIVFGNGGVPDIKEPYAMPSDIDAAVKQFQTSLESTPAQQPRYFDENGNPLTPLPVGGEDPFGTWIAYAMYSKDFKPSLMVEALTYFPVTAEELAA